MMLLWEARLAAILWFTKPPLARKLSLVCVGKMITVQIRFELARTVQLKLVNGLAQVFQKR